MAMAVVGFAVLFVGIVSPQVATASTAALLLFVLPVAVAQPAAAVGPRLLGWVVAGAFCIPACMLVWPTPWHDDLRRRLSATLSAVGPAGDAHGRAAVPIPGPVRRGVGAVAAADASSPGPPTRPPAPRRARSPWPSWWVGSSGWPATPYCSGCEPLGPGAVVRAMVGAVAETLRLCASLICDGHAHPVDDPALVQAVQESTRRLDRLIDSELDDEVSMLIDLGADRGDAEASGRAGPMGSAHEYRLLAGPDLSGPGPWVSPPGWWPTPPSRRPGPKPVGDRRLGVAADSIPRGLWSRLASHLSFRSVWFRNAVRGAAGLALAVAVVEVTDVEHGFWVVLGTLSVLRSNALGTGATALRAVGGTAVGFVVGSAIMIGVADHTVLLWVLLPVAVLVVGRGPVDDLVRRRAGRLHPGGGHSVQHHRSCRLEGRPDQDRGRGPRLCGEHRGWAVVLAPGRHGGSGASTFRCVRHELGLPGRRRGALDHDDPPGGH